MPHDDADDDRAVDPGRTAACYYAAAWNTLERHGGVIRQSDRDCLAELLRATPWEVIRDSRSGVWASARRGAGGGQQRVGKDERAR
jgi:hypothetical protein